MSKFKSRFIVLFLRVLILGALGTALTLGAAFGSETSAPSWKPVGRKALLHIPAPAETKNSSRLKDSYLRSFSKKSDLDQSFKNHFIKK